MTTAAEDVGTVATAATVATGGVAHSGERPQATATGEAVTLIQHRTQTIMVMIKLIQLCNLL